MILKVESMAFCWASVSPIQMRGGGGCWMELNFLLEQQQQQEICCTKERIENTMGFLCKLQKGKWQNLICKGACLTEQVRQVWMMAF
jgi:hypothetical protein